MYGLKRLKGFKYVRVRKSHAKESMVAFICDALDWLAKR